MERKTIKEFIDELQVLAKEYGEDIPVCVYDEYTANEGWDYTEGDLYGKATAEMYEPFEEDVEDGAPAKCILIR